MYYTCLYLKFKMYILQSIINVPGIFVFLKKKKIPMALRISKSVSYVHSYLAGGWSLIYIFLFYRFAVGKTYLYRHILIPIGVSG